MFVSRNAQHEQALDDCDWFESLNELTWLWFLAQCRSMTTSGLCHSSTFTTLSNWCWGVYSFNSRCCLCGCLATSEWVALGAIVLHGNGIHDLERGVKETLRHSVRTLLLWRHCCQWSVQCSHSLRFPVTHMAHNEVSVVTTGRQTHEWITSPRPPVILEWIWVPPQDT